MPFRVTVAAVLALAGAAAFVPAAPVTERPPAGYTGGFGEPSCVECHIGSDVNAFGGRVALEGLPYEYEAGREYLVTVVLEAEGTELAGFQLTARYADGMAAGTDAGRLEAMDARVGITDSAGVAYAHQTRSGARAGGDRASWTLAWVAPEGRDPIAFHVAANSGNGDNSPLSDLVYTSEAYVSARR